jgi:hypothetical protein
VLSAAEIARGVQGALGFLQRDHAAPLRFDNTMEACLRSFRVMALAAPLYALYRLIYYASGTVTVTADEMEIVLAESVFYVVDWLLFPVIFYEVARRRGWLDRYPRYIGALNWMRLPIVVISVVSVAFETVVAQPVAVVLELCLEALYFYWFLMTTRMVLGVNWPTAVVLLVVNWVPSLLLFLLVSRYVGLVSAAAG